MINPRVVTATEARTNFFKILGMVDAGEEVTIIKRDSNKRYKIMPVIGAKKPNFEKILEEMGKIGFKAGTPREIKRIIEKRYEG